MGFSRQEYWSGVPLPSLAGHLFLSVTVSSAVLTGTQPPRVSTGQPGSMPTESTAQFRQWWEGARAAAVRPGRSESLRKGTEDSGEMPEALYLRLGLEPVSMCAKLLSRVRLCATHRRQPTRLPRPWDSPGKNTGVGCHFLLQCMKVKRESEVAQSGIRLLATP